MEKQAVIRTLPDALKVIKDMNLGSADEWSGDYRHTIARVLKDQMEERIAGHLSWAYNKGIPDRRNGSYIRRVLTELGTVALSIPRTRCVTPKGIIAAYARRIREIDHLILACFLRGLSTRKVGVALATLLGEKISPQTVSRVAKTLDEAVTAFHARRITTRFRALILDGIIIKRRTGAGTLTRPVLVALGIRHDGKKEVIDFRCARSESGAEWRTFLTDLMKRGVTGFEVICADGGQGLISILPEVYPHIPLQRCWAHKMRNTLDKVPRKKQPSVKKGLRKIYGAKTSPRHKALQHDGPVHGETNARKRSGVSRTTLRICSPVFSSMTLTFAKRSARLMRLSAASGKYDGEHVLWGCSVTERASRGSSMRYSCMRT